MLPMAYTFFLESAKHSDMQELVNYYSMADVYVNTLEEETLGMISVESLSCRTPVIVYNVTACPETVSSECGFVVEPHNLDRIAGIVNHIRGVGKHSYSDIYRHHAVEHFNEADRFSEYMDLYKCLTVK